MRSILVVATILFCHHLLILLFGAGNLWAAEHLEKRPLLSTSSLCQNDLSSEYQTYASETISSHASDLREEFPFSRTPPETDSLAISPEKRRQHLLRTTLVGAGLITVWGVLEWDYFSTSPHAESEGWFDRDTDSGGADKLGHAYTTYTFSHALTALYKHWGIEDEHAALYGATSSFAILSYMELGDSFSDYGFSYEDLIANGVGALFGYVLAVNEELAEKIDFRWEYDFSFDKTDIFTDYENSRYLVALKLNGFEGLRQGLWRHLELHLGYYSRHFEDKGENRERNIYLGVGFNLTDFFSRHSWEKTATVLRYVQLPHTSVTVSHSLD